MKNSIFPIIVPKAMLIAGLCSIAVMLPAQAGTDLQMSQYLFPDFTACVVKLKNGVGDNMVVNYNTITEMMAIKKDDIIYGMASINLVDTIIINDRHFVPVGKVFYEVIVNAPVSAFIQHKSKLLPPGKPVGYGGTSKTASVDSYSYVPEKGGVYKVEILDDSEIKPSPLYWVRKDDSMISFLNKRQFVKIFPEKSTEIEAFINQNNIKIENRDDLIRLVNYCNKIIQHK